MAERSSIEWTEATWNPVVGCDIVSPGCTNCYAMKDAWRKNSNPRLPRYHGLTKMTKGGPVWTGEVRTVPELLDWPLRKKKPLRIFVDSMSDLFHEDVPDEFIDAVFAVMALAHWHTFQILTKRPERMRDYLRAPHARRGMAAAVMPLSNMLAVKHRSAKARIKMADFERAFPPGDAPPWPNIWLGTSVEDQRRADERIVLLLQTPAAVRWISAEPLLGSVDLTKTRHQLVGQSFEIFDSLYHKDSLNKGQPRPGLDWVVVGGESGPGARPMHPDWARSLRDQCAAAGVPFFFKQWGAWAPWTGGYPPGPPYDAHTEAYWPNGTIGYGSWGQSGGSGMHLVRVGKKAAGRELDGRTHDEYPA